MKTINDIKHVKGVKVLVRVDFNVPIRNGVVADDIRLRAALPTINFLREKGAKVILISHIEVMEGEKATLEPVATKLSKLGLPVTFLKKYERAVEIIHGMKDGDCLLLENLRMHEGEKKNDPKFARQLASLADIFVNDAFSVSHREHASVVGVPALMPSYAGLQFTREVENISKAFNPEHPFLFILGGAKFGTKLPLLNKFMKSADWIFVGGALANDFYKAKGYATGKSLLSEGTFDLTSFIASPKLLIPVDVVTDKGEVKADRNVGPNDKILDAGPATVELIAEKVKAAKFVLWNGPLGLYEDGYKGPTLEVAGMLAEASSRGATTIVGGGDTLAAIATLGTEDKYTFVSTAGGAMLDFLSQGTLPGIDALNKSDS